MKALWEHYNCFLAGYKITNLVYFVTEGRYDKYQGTSVTKIHTDVLRFSSANVRQASANKYEQTFILKLCKQTKHTPHI
jgi:hypothetical protein